MTPRAGVSNPYPVLVASKIRAWFDYQRLDVRLRLRIRARRHTHGVQLTPVDTDDAEAKKWIQAQVDRWGTMTWSNGLDTRGGKPGWRKEKSKKDST